MDKLQVITACALICKDNKILIAKRSATKKFLPNIFEIPGGHIEYGESIEEGLIREVQEELHIDVKIGDPVYVFTYVVGDNHIVEIDYLAYLKNPNQEIILNEEDHSEFRWLDEEEIDKYMPPEDRELPAVKKAFKIIKINEKSLVPK